MAHDTTVTIPRSLVPVAAFFAIAGVLHFVVPAFFERIVPPWVPNARLAVQLSGIAEVAGAVGLLFARSRVATGWGLIALLVAVFPANVQMLQLARASDARAWYVAMLWARLPLQALLVWWVWRGAISRRRGA